jgi:methyl-accepting chemotaxis protein
LRSEVDQFLAAMTHAGERRTFERRPHDVPVTLHVKHESMAGRMVDISDGGSSLRIDGNWDVGMPATIMVQGAELPGRIVESGNGIVRIQFLFNQETHDKVMELFDHSLAA